MVPGGRPLIAIGYKYNTQKVLSFITTADTDSKKSGIPFLFKYPEPYHNVVIHPVARPLVMSKFSGSVDGVDSHNKSRQSDLALENLWVTQRGWLRLCTTAAMGMNITNFCKKIVMRLRYITMKN